jgi:hypothetical protein
MDELSDLTIYGASDDLVEFDGEICDEFNCYGLWKGRLLSPAGKSLIISAQFSKPGASSDWTITVENDSAPFPDWPMNYCGRPGEEDRDPALHLFVPPGTRIIPLTDRERLPL